MRGFRGSSHVQHPLTVVHSYITEYRGLLGWIYCTVGIVLHQHHLGTFIYFYIFLFLFITKGHFFFIAYFFKFSVRGTVFCYSSLCAPWIQGCNSVGLFSPIFIFCPTIVPCCMCCHWSIAVIIVSACLATSLITMRQYLSIESASFFSPISWIPQHLKKSY